MAPTSTREHHIITASPGTATTQNSFTIQTSSLHPSPSLSADTPHIPVKSLHGVFDTPLNGVWDTVGPQIRDLIKARQIHWSSVNPARFFTHAPLGEAKGSLSPVVIWVSVIPSSTSADTAHEVSREILDLLLKNGVEGVVVEWCEAVLQRCST
jgi:hypothetical protein